MKTAIALVLALALGGAGLASVRELTGYGATRKAWFAHHDEAKYSFLRAGCCFGPRQSDGQFRYYNVQYTGSKLRVFMYNMDFGPRLSSKDALKQIKRELPPDARLARHKRKKRCEQFDYTSARAKRVLGQKHVGVEFAADPTTSDSYKGKVRKVTVGNLVSTSEDCGLF